MKFLGSTKIATEFQKSKSVVTWPQFDKTLTTTEIKENGYSKLNNTNGLPEYYKNATVSLFEIKLKD